MDDLRNAGYLLSYQLQFFADAAEKTEEPTAKKLSEARKQGQVARSKELITAAGLTALFLVIRAFVGFFSDQFQGMFKKTYSSIGKIAGGELTPGIAHSLFNDMVSTILITCLPVFIVGVLVSFVVVLFQVKWKISAKPMQPKLSKLNPISGFKKIFSKQKLVELVFEVVKIAIIAFIVFGTLKDEWKTLMLLYDISLLQAVILIGDIILSLGLKICLFFLLIGFADLFYQKIKFKKDMRMTKQEVKDEYKNQEGDPKIKSQIRSRMREASQRRMMQQLPKADVVITNPTHLAAALQYDKNISEAPVLIAKGADYLAEKIKEIARENNIAIVENKPLARMLYYNVEIGNEIPPELYQMAAEVLAYVYGLKNQR
jgi:flagellar biosynthetic protein FlhB